MRLLGRSCLIAFIICGLLNLPVFSAVAGERALGVVIQSEIGRLGNGPNNVAVGTSVYPGDSLWTDIGGSMRVKVGSGQLYLLASSTITLGQDEDFVQATLTRGTVGMSAATTDKLEIAMPEGILRPVAGQSAYGQVTMLSPNEVIISAYRGAMMLDNVGETHMIGAGSAYRVVILPDDTQQPQGAATQEYPEGKMKYPKRRHLALTLILLSAAGVGAFFLYDKLTESPSRFN